MTRFQEGLEGVAAGAFSTTLVGGSAAGSRTFHCGVAMYDFEIGLADFRLLIAPTGSDHTLNCLFSLINADNPSGANITGLQSFSEEDAAVTTRKTVQRSDLLITKIPAGSQIICTIVVGGSNITNQALVGVDLHPYVK